MTTQDVVVIIYREYILSHYLQRHGTMTAALAAYSGNPRSTRYPKKVMATFRELASET